MTGQISVVVSELFIPLPDTTLHAQLAVGGSQRGIVFLLLLLQVIGQEEEEGGFL